MSNCPLGMEAEAGLRERLARIETEARHAREIASSQADDIGRMMERLDMQEMRIERNERAIWDDAMNLKSLSDACHTLKAQIHDLMRDKAQRQMALAVLKYGAAGLLLALVFLGKLTSLEAHMARSLFGLP